VPAPRQFLGTGKAGRSRADDGNPLAGAADEAASVRTQELGAAPNRRFVIEWRNVRFYSDPTLRLRFEIVLLENGEILLQYADVDATSGA